MKSYILFFLFKKCHNHHWLLFCKGAYLNLSVWTGPNRNQNPGIRSRVHLKTWLQTTTLGSQLDTRRPELLFPPYYLFFLQWLCNVKYRSNSDQQPLFGAGFYKRGPHSRDPFPLLLPTSLWGQDLKAVSILVKKTAQGSFSDPVAN